MTTEASGETKWHPEVTKKQYFLPSGDSYDSINSNKAGTIDTNHQ